MLTQKGKGSCTRDVVELSLFGTYRKYGGAIFPTCTRFSTFPSHIIPKLATIQVNSLNILMTL